jgi:hypothetical protein
MQRLISSQHSRYMEGNQMSSNEPAIRLVRPLQQEYMTVGYILSLYGNSFYTMTLNDFVHLAMTHAHGSLNPSNLKLIYLKLMEEAGLKIVPVDPTK